MFERKPAGTTIVALLGEFDLSERQRMDEALAAALGSALIVLDLARVHYLDSTALGCILRLRRAALDEGRSLIIINASAFAKRLFVISGLAAVVDIREKLQDIEVEHISQDKAIELIELVSNSFTAQRSRSGL